MTELYRLKLGIRNGSASWGDWKYFEGREAFERSLLESLISESARKDHRTNRAAAVACGLWNKYVLKNEDGPQVDSVFSADKLVDGQWVTLSPRLVPPRLEFDFE